MKIKKLLLKMSVIVGILSITSMPALAANYRSYDKVLVKKVSDYISGGLVKQTTGSAYNNVTYIYENGALVSWIVDSNNNRKTAKVSYSSTGNKTMNYNGNASDLKGKQLKLRISTAATNFSATTTSGSWTPN